MGMLRAALLVLSAALMVGTIQPGLALAQDDWSVKRDPFDKRIVARYKRLLAKNPNDRGALDKLVKLYQRHRSVDKLVSEYEAAAAKSPAFATLVVLGHLYLDRGEADKALAQYEHAAALEPKDAAVHAAIGALHMRAGNAAQARAAYERALPLARGPQKKPVLRALADLALGAKDIDAARRYFDAYIALEPKNVQLRVELAEALTAHGLHDEAIEVLVDVEKRVRTDPARRVEIVARIGAIYEAMGKDDAAIREYRRAMSMTKRGYYLRRELIERVIEIHRRRQDLGALVTHYERTWKPSSRGHLEWDVLARLYEETGNQEKAIAAYRKAVAKAPYELDTQRRFIALLENSGREAEALTQFERVIKVAPGEPRFQLELARRYWTQGKPKEALALLAKIEKRFPFDAGVQVALADMYSQWGKEDAAVKVYERLTKIDGDELEHFVTLGEHYFQRGLRDKALATWKRIAAHKTPAAYARLGDVYSEHDMHDKAIAMYDKAVKGDPKNPARYRGRARVYERQRRFEQARKDWEQALALTSDKPTDRPARREARRRIVGLWHREQRGRLEMQRRRWERAMAANPPDIEAGYFLVETYDKLRQAPKARATLERILRLRPDDIEAMTMLVKAYKDERKYGEAIALLDRLIPLSPGRERELYSEIAELKTLQHKDDEAILYSRKALEKSPNDPVAHEAIARTYERLGKPDRAIEEYEKTIELDPRRFPVYFRLATLYERRGDRRDTARLYRAVLRQSTDEQILHQAGRKAIVLEEYMGTLGELERIVAPLAFTFTHKPMYRNILVELYARYVPMLVARSHGDDPVAAAEADAELERLGKHGLKPLLEALADEDNPSQQRIAVAVLGFIRNKGAAMPLVKLANDPRGATPTRRRAIGTLRPTVDMAVRVEALIAAGRLGDPRIIPELIPLLSHREKPMREAAAFALGMTGDRAAAKPLLEALDNQSQSSVRMLACFGLAHIDKGTHRKRIERAVTDDESRRVRAACAFGLGAIAHRDSVPVLIATLADGNEELQRVAAWALGRIGDRRATAGLLSAYFGKGDRVRGAVAWALPRVASGRRDAADVVALRDFPLKFGSYDQVGALEAAVGVLAPPPLSPDLILGHESELVAGIRAALDEPKNTNVVLRALRDLDAREDGLGLGALTTKLDDAPAADRDKVRSALDRIGTAILPDVARLATDGRDREVRARALSVASKIGGTAAEQVLLAGIDDRDGSVRARAMHAAGRMGGPRLAEAVTSGLGAAAWKEREAAAVALRAFGEHAPTEALVKALGDEYGYVRSAAAATLGVLGRKQAVDALVKASRDEMPTVRTAAVVALGQIGGAKARARVTEMAASDPDPGVRKTASKIK